MVIAYVRFCRDIIDLDRDPFASRYPDLYTAAGQVAGLFVQQIVDRFHDLHQRHAKSVLSVIEAGIRDHAGSLINERLPRGALLSLCTGRTRLDPPSIADVTEQMTDFMSRLQQPVCELAVDEKGKRILFRGDLMLDSADFRRFRALLDNHRQAKAEAMEVPCFPPWKLAEKLGIIRIVEQSHLPIRRTLEQFGIPRRSSRASIRHLLGAQTSLPLLRWS